MARQTDLEAKIAKKVAESWRGDVVRHFQLELPTEVAEYVPWGREGLLAPRRFSALVKDARYPLRIEVAIEDGRALCTAVARIEAKIRPDGRRTKIRLDSGLRIEKGPAISGTFLRKIPLDRIVREITDVAARHLRPIFDPLTAEERAAWMPAIAATEGRAMVGRARTRPTGRGAKLSDGELHDAAAVYRKAFERGDPPVEAVRSAFWLSRSSAGRWITEARRRGFLPPTEPRRAKA